MGPQRIQRTVSCSSAQASGSKPPSIVMKSEALTQLKESYMVEENVVREDLSFAEMAQVADDTVAVAIPRALPRLPFEEQLAAAGELIESVFAEQLAVIGRRHFL